MDAATGGQGLLEGETHGRRDTVFIYSGNYLEAIVKENIKMNVPKAGENPIGAKFYDVQRDTREEYPVSTEIGAWGGAEMARIIQRHMARKQQYPSEGAATGMPYDGIENLRPESKEAVKAFLVRCGVTASQIDTEAKGQTYPRRPNFTESGEDNPQGRRANRRSEIYLDF